MKTFNNLIKSFFKRGAKNYTGFVKLDHDSYLITNGYAVLRLNANSKSMVKKLKDWDIQELKSEGLKRRILEYYEEFINSGFYNVSKLEHVAGSEKNIVEINESRKKHNITYNLYMIHEIQNILNTNVKDHVYTSNTNTTTISITGKNGFGFLLGMRTY